MSEFFVVLLSGIASGSIYGLMGLGMVIIFRATDVVNFAMAALGTFGVYLSLTLLDQGVGVVVASLIAIVLVGLTGAAVREVVIRPLGGGQLFAALVVTMGVSLILESVLGQVWGEQPRAFPSLVTANVSIGSSAIRGQQLLTIVIAAVAMVLVALLFQRTLLGTAMRAAAESPENAQVVGIDHHRVARIAWLIGCSLAALAAILYAPLSGVTPTVFTAILFRAFAGIFLGGLTSMYGAVLGGLAVGVLDNLAASYISASFRDTFVFSVVVLMLLVRPQGLFGERTFQRV